MAIYLASIVNDRMLLDPNVKMAIYPAAVFHAKMSIYTTAGPNAKMDIYSSAIEMPGKAKQTAAEPNVKMAEDTADVSMPKWLYMYTE